MEVNMPDVRMNYDSMEQMANAFHQAGQQIEQTITAATNVANQMTGGALVGLGGDEFVGAINEQLVPRLKALTAKMYELENDIKGAVACTRDGVTTAASRFKN
jgi:hypothetical protein